MEIYAGMGKETGETMEIIDMLPAHERALYTEWVVNSEFVKIGKTTEVCLLVLSNDLEIVGIFTCTHPEMFNEEMGKFYALRDAMDRLRAIDGAYKFYTQVQEGARG